MLVLLRDGLEKTIRVALMNKNRDIQFTSGLPYRSQAFIVQAYQISIRVFILQTKLFQYFQTFGAFRHMLTKKVDRPIDKLAIIADQRFIGGFRESRGGETVETPRIGFYTVAEEMIYIAGRDAISTITHLQRDVSG